MIEEGTIIEGRCADCVLNLLQISGRGPGKYGYCRLRRLVLEFPWAMICQHYQYWGDRPTPGKSRLLLERPSRPLLDYSSQKPIQVSLSPGELKVRHKDEVDDDVKRNVGAALTAQEFIDAPFQRQYDLLCGFLSGFNPYNFVIAVNALHHFPVENLSPEKRDAIFERLLSEERKVAIEEGPGLIADKLVYCTAFSLARVGRDLLEYIDSLRLRKHRPGYEDKILAAARKFVQNPELKPRGGILSFLLGR